MKRHTGTDDGEREREIGVGNLWTYSVHTDRFGLSAKVGPNVSALHKAARAAKEKRHGAAAIMSNTIFFTVRARHS